MEPDPTGSDAEELAAMLLTWMRVEFGQELAAEGDHLAEARRHHGEAPTAVFAQAVASGVLFCEILHAIDPLKLPATTILRGARRRAKSAPGGGAAAAADRFADTAPRQQYKQNTRRACTAIRAVFGRAPGEALVPTFRAAVHTPPATDPLPALRLGELVLAAAMYGRRSEDFIWGVWRVQCEKTKYALYYSLQRTAKALGLPPIDSLYRDPVSEVTPESRRLAEKHRRIASAATATAIATGGAAAVATSIGTASRRGSGTSTITTTTTTTTTSPHLAFRAKGRSPSKGAAARNSLKLRTSVKLLNPEDHLDLDNPTRTLSAVTDEGIDEPVPDALGRLGSANSDSEEERDPARARNALEKRLSALEGTPKGTRGDGYWETAARLSEVSRTKRILSSLEDGRASDERRAAQRGEEQQREGRRMTLGGRREARARQNGAIGSRESSRAERSLHVEFREGSPSPAAAAPKAEGVASPSAEAATAPAERQASPNGARYADHSIEPGDIVLPPSVAYRALSGSGSSVGVLVEEQQGLSDEVSQVTDPGAPVARSESVDASASAKGNGVAGSDVQETAGHGDGAEAGNGEEDADGASVETEELEEEEMSAERYSKDHGVSPAMNNGTIPRGPIVDEDDVENISSPDEIAAEIEAAPTVSTTVSSGSSQRISTMKPSADLFKKLMTMWEPGRGQPSTEPERTRYSRHSRRRAVRIESRNGAPEEALANGSAGNEAEISKNQGQQDVNHTGQSPATPTSTAKTESPGAREAAGEANAPKQGAALPADPLSPQAISPDMSAVLESRNSRVRPPSRLRSPERMRSPEPAGEQGARSPREARSPQRSLSPRRARSPEGGARSPQRGRPPLGPLAAAAAQRKAEARLTTATGMALEHGVAPRNPRFDDYISTSSVTSDGRVRVDRTRLDWLVQEMLKARETIMNKDMQLTMAAQESREHAEVLMLEREEAENVIAAMKTLLNERELELEAARERLRYTLKEAQATNKMSREREEREIREMYNSGMQKFDKAAVERHEKHLAEMRTQWDGMKKLLEGRFRTLFDERDKEIAQLKSELGRQVDETTRLGEERLKLTEENSAVRAEARTARQDKDLVIAEAAMEIGQVQAKLELVDKFSKKLSETFKETEALRAQVAAAQQQMMDASQVSSNERALQEQAVRAQEELARMHARLEIAKSEKEQAQQRVMEMERKLEEQRELAEQERQRRHLQSSAKLSTPRSTFTEKKKKRSGLSAIREILFGSSNGGKKKGRNGKKSDQSGELSHFESPARNSGYSSSRTPSRRESVPELDSAGYSPPAARTPSPRSNEDLRKYAIEKQQTSTRVAAQQFYA